MDYQESLKPEHTYHKHFVHYWAKIRDVIGDRYPDKEDQQRILLYVEFAYKSGFEEAINLMKGK